MGTNLMKTVVEATGLPEAPVFKELESLIIQHNFSCENLSIEELRLVMADYLQSVFLELASDDISA